MNHTWPPPGLAIVLIELLLSSAAAQADKMRAVRAIGVHTPNGWLLDINTDGSGRVTYGSGIGWPFKPAIFDVEKITKTLQALANDEKGTGGSHFVFSFEAERKAADIPGPARYSRDTEVILALFERAIDAAEVKKHDRGALILKKNPPGLPKDK